MNIRYIYTVVVLLAFLLPSCEEIIDINVPQSEPMKVIDASITENSPCVVYLSRSQSFNDNTPYEPISGAIIELRDEDGNVEFLLESTQKSGLYISDMMGVVNKKYYIKVEVEGKVHEASAAIPESVPINQVYLYEIKAGNKSWYSPSFTYDDPPGIRNYYYCIMTVNDKIMSSIYLHDDEFTNGTTDNLEILFFDKDDNDDNELETGDHVSIEMQSLDIGMYTYYQSLFTAANGGATNPLTNLSGGALGCFKAYNSSYGDMVVSADRIYSKEKRLPL